MAPAEVLQAADQEGVTLVEVRPEEVVRTVELAVIQLRNWEEAVTDRHRPAPARHVFRMTRTARVRMHA